MSGYILYQPLKLSGFLIEKTVDKRQFLFKIG